MVTSLFDTTVRDILYKSINPKFLKTGGFKTYSYIDECIIPLIKNYDNDKDRAINVGTINNDMTVWLIGHYHYSKVSYEHGFNSIYIGKSIIPTVVGERRDIKDKYNVVFDTSILNRILYPKEELTGIDKIKIVLYYWNQILFNMFKRDSVFDISGCNITVFNMYVESFGMYMQMCNLYHMYNLLTLDWLKTDTIFECTELPDDFFEELVESPTIDVKGISNNIINSYGLNTDEEEFKKFVGLVKLYITR